MTLYWNFCKPKTENLKSREREKNYIQRNYSKYVGDSQKKVWTRTQSLNKSNCQLRVPYSKNTFQKGKQNKDISRKTKPEIIYNRPTLKEIFTNLSSSGSGKITLDGNVEMLEGMKNGGKICIYLNRYIYKMCIHSLKRKITLTYVIPNICRINNICQQRARNT